MTTSCGLWNAGFGAVGATLKALEDAGGTLEFLKLIRSDENVAEAVVKAGNAFLRNRYADERISSSYDYPHGYNGAKELEEQATILRETYQFPLKPLANVKKLPEGAEGFWVSPLIQGIVPLQCEYPYNYAVDFVLERLNWERQLENCRRGETGHSHLRQSERSLRLWSQLTLVQGGGEMTPIIPAQFGRRHRGESANFTREDALDNEILLGVYHIGVMLLSHPEREQVWEQLHISCAGDEIASDNGSFIKVPVYEWHSDKLHFAANWANNSDEHYGSASGFIPQD